jgi:deferrochelatase/peroxidase EfeB
MSVTATDFRQVQGLIRFGYGRLTESSFLLLTIRDAEAARAWLRTTPVSNAVACETAPITALQVAFTRSGLEKLGVGDDLLAGFSAEFLSGMTGDPSRSRLLGDVGASAPENWEWGRAERLPDVLVLLYAQPGHLHGWSEQVQNADWRAGFDLLGCLPTTDLDGFEPFGFADSISQPALDWNRTRSVKADQLAYSNQVSLGEFVLGYPNEYGRYTERPVLAGDDPSGSRLPVAEENSAVRDFGRDGCYLVLRTLEQDVRGFWKFVNDQAGSEPAKREALASAMVGRRRDGTPLVPASEATIPGVEPDAAAQNQFTFDGDASGTLCPFGAHIRRANPRNADLPTPPVHGLRKVLRALGLGQRDLHSDAKASARFHRVLRRGREYGSGMSPEQAIAPGAEAGPRGIQFMCLVGNIARQFEFLQNAWLMSTKFDALSDESDPLLGNREPIGGCAAADTFSLPRAGGLRDRITRMPQFVTVKGGGYFFLPSLPAIRYLATLGGAKAGTADH